MEIRFILVLIYITTALLAIAAIPTYSLYAMRVFENPADISNSLIYFGIIVGFTAFLLLLSKFWASFLQKFMYLLILISIWYVLMPFFGLISIAFASVLIVLLVKNPNWLIINISALLLAVGITSIFGMSLEPTPVIVLLLILAAYDAISVYETGHMVSLADSITKMKLPLLFIIPYTRDFSISSINEMRDKAILMGVGDVVIPNLLVVSSQVFSNSSYIGFLKISALFTLLGGVLGLLLLITLMKKRTIHAGLPLLNFGAISGYLLSSLF